VRKERETERETERERKRERERERKDTDIRHTTVDDISSSKHTLTRQ
jgi:hypothetical protein